VTVARIVPASAWRIVLCGGLLGHKLVWELLKRGHVHPTAQHQPASIARRAVKLAKIGVLLGLVAQTLCLEIAPLPARLRALRPLGLGLYLLGLAGAIAGRLSLGSAWHDLEDAHASPVGDTVSHGIYRLVRHPIYAGDTLLLFGLELALGSWLVALVVAPAAIFVRRARAEEARLEAASPAYARYRSRVKMFIPFVL
jgi:protein-S-isoprenylcysteine O-methyltransferase Ste14